MRIDFSNFKSLLSIANYFDNNITCKQTLAQARWNGDVVCPYCGQHHCVTRKDGRYRCNHCKRNFSVLVGTIFEASNISLQKWFMAMYLISSHKKGVSSYQLGRDIEVTQKTAWYMLQKIRTLFAQDDAVALEDEVELDEVYIGGKEKWKHMSKRTEKTQGRSIKTKTPVFGMIQRTIVLNAKGKEESMSYVKAFKVEKTDGATLLPIVQQFVATGTSVITDELNSYNGLSKLGYKHYVVNHGQAQYVCGGVFTNDMEGFWSHFRRMIAGCYHDISDKYLQRYIDEACYRWNTRKASQVRRFSDMFYASIGIVTYDDVRMTNVV